MAIPVKLPVFEGPLDLLMHLIEKNKIDIYDIPIAEITDQYLEYVRQMDREDMDVTSEFLVMAATLLDIKSRMLLPREKDEETGEEEADPREELVRRLLEYKKYRYLSEELAVRREQAGVRFFREQQLPKEVRSYQPPIDYGELLGNVDLARLEKVFGEVLRRKKSRRDPIRSGFGKIRRDEVNIDNKSLYIRAFLRTHPHTDFQALLESQESREEVIVTFLILLELMKNQKVHIVQDSIGGKILVEASESEHTETPPEGSASPETASADAPAADPEPDETSSMEAQAEDSGLDETASMEAQAEDSGLDETASMEAQAEDPGLDAPSGETGLADTGSLHTPFEESDPAETDSADALLTDTDTEAASPEENTGNLRKMQAVHTTGVALSSLRRVEVTAPLPPAFAEEIPFPISAAADADVTIPTAVSDETDIPGSIPGSAGGVTETVLSFPTAPSVTEEGTLRPAAAQEDPLLTTAVPEDGGTGTEYPEAEGTGTSFQEAEGTGTEYPEAENTGTEYPEDENTGTSFQEAEGTGTEYPEAEGTEENISDDSAECCPHFSARLWQGRSPRCEVAAAFSGIHSTGAGGPQGHFSPCRSLWERNRLSRLWARRRS